MGERTEDGRRHRLSETVSTETRRDLPRLFGHYRIESEIAAGGMGRVYRAIDVRLDRPVALKLMHHGHAAAEEELVRFRAEAMAAARLEHPGIVQVFEADDVDGIPYIAMGLVDGKSLNELLRERPMASREIAKALSQIARAVAFAHERGVVHRDLKPGNVLVDHGGTPKITDFGLAKRIDTGQELTTTGQVLGTPSYMPPEQARGQIAEIGPLSDVYGLGGILYFMLTGLPPFRAANTIETIRQVIDTPVRPPRAINPGIDRDLETLALKCLEKRPTDRLPSAAALADELDRYLNGEPIRYRRIGPVKRAFRWCRRKPLAAMVAVAVPLLLFASSLAWHFNERSRLHRQTLAINDQIQTAIELFQPTQQTLAEMDFLLDQLRANAPEMAEQAEQRMLRAFRASVETVLDQPRLTDADYVLLQQQLELLALRDAAAAAPLQSRFDARRKEWRQLIDVTTPISDLNGVIDSDRVTFVDGGFQHREHRLLVPDVSNAYWHAPTLATHLHCEEDFEAEIEFAGDWTRQTSIGISLIDGEQSFCHFVLRSSVTAIGEQPLLMSDADKRGQAVVAEIVAHGQVLRQETIDLRRFRLQPLRMRARREGESLLLQLNEHPPILFTSVFRGYSPNAAIGLITTNASTIKTMRVGKKMRDDESALAQGDRHYVTGNRKVALAIYQSQADAGATETIRQEARFKAAVCLIDFNRTAEGVARLQSVAAEAGDRWPALAGMELWIAHLNGDNQTEADTLAEFWRSRFTKPSYKTIPIGSWQTVGNRYAMQAKLLSHAMRPDSRRVTLLEAIAEIDRRFTPHQLGTPYIQLALVNAYRLHDRFDEALQVLDATRSVWTGEQRIQNLTFTNRLLRRLGRPADALQIIDDAIRDLRDSGSNPRPILLWRIRTLVALERWDEAEAEADSLLANLEDTEHTRHELIDTTMAKGCLALRREDHVAAQAAFRRGWSAGARLVEAQEALAASAMLNGIIQGCLCEEFTPRHLQLLLTHPEVKTNPMLDVSLNAIQSNTLYEGITRSWRTELGQEIAEDLAFDRLTMRERIQRPAALMSSGTVAVSLMGRVGDNAFMSLLNRLAEELMQSMLTTQRLGPGQVAQLGMTWKGTTNFFGWKGVRPSLNDFEAQAVALIMAHRFVKIDAASSEIEAMWDQASEGHDPIVTELARQGRELYQQASAKLFVTNESEQLVLLRIAPTSGDSPTELEVPPNASSELEIRLPAGSYNLSCKPATATDFQTLEMLQLRRAARCRVVVP
ncbi:MAG: protein kinase [Planctomycetales bacterium]|nr:protein kinase [Planctomycetales bacterium]